MKFELLCPSGLSLSKDPCIVSLSNGLSSSKGFPVQRRLRQGLSRARRRAQPERGIDISTGLINKYAKEKQVTTNSALKICVVPMEGCENYRSMLDMAERQLTMRTAASTLGASKES